MRSDRAPVAGLRFRRTVRALRVQLIDGVRHQVAPTLAVPEKVRAVQVYGHSWRLKSAKYLHIIRTMAVSFNHPSQARMLGERLRRARMQAGYSQEAVCAVIGVSHSQISRIERGIFKGPGKNVQILCRFLEVDWREVANDTVALSPATVSTPLFATPLTPADLVSAQASGGGDTDAAIEIAERFARAARVSPLWATALTALAQAVEMIQAPSTGK
jgi:transcriptional regulator with XRE-family HTH domain